MKTRLVILVALVLANFVPGQLFAAVPEGDVAATFAQLNTNGDGVLDLAEFTKLEVTDE